MAEDPARSIHPHAIWSPAWSSRDLRALADVDQKIGRALLVCQRIGCTTTFCCHGELTERRVAGTRHRSSLGGLDNSLFTDTLTIELVLGLIGAFTPGFTPGLSVDL